MYIYIYIYIYMGVWLYIYMCIYINKTTLPWVFCFIKNILHCFRDMYIKKTYWNIHKINFRGKPVILDNWPKLFIVYYLIPLIFHRSDQLLWYCSVLTWSHYSDVIINAMAPQITGVSIIFFVVCSGVDQKHQSSASLAFMRGIHRWPLDSPHKEPVTRKCFHLMTSSFG